MRAAAALAAALLLPAPVSAAPLDAFAAAFGPEGVAALAERGYIVLQGRGAGRRLAAVHWKALENLAAASPACRAFARESADAAEGSLSASGSVPPFDACRALPEEGAMTRRLHALAAALAAAREESRALASSSASLTEPDGLVNIFETPWGRELAARRRADRLADPAPLAKWVFDELLAGPRSNPDAVGHFLAATAARGTSSADVLLAADAKRGAASDGLRALIRRWLQDERRRRGLAIELEFLRAAIDKSARRELAALDGLASAFAAKPDLLASLEAAVPGAPAAPGPPRLHSAGLRLQEPTRLGQHELGDEAAVSGAYWVDGLAEGASAEFEETTFIETPRGFSAVETRVVKRRNGGPYPFERRLSIEETRPFAVRAVVSAGAGAAVSERAEVPVAPDFELALRKEAEALRRSQSCDPKAAEDAYASLESLVADAAKVKPQYEDLLDRARRGRRAAQDDDEALSRLDEAVGNSRVDSSPQRCRFDLAGTDAAIKLARKLPPGCDRVLPELFAQRALISRRSADQAWFMRSSAEARSRRRACDFAGAAERWTEALAVLDADPAARCGAVADEALKAESELAAARRSSAWDEALDKALDKAESSTEPAERLDLLRPLIARLSALDDRDCRGPRLKRARRLEAQAGMEPGS